MAKKELTVADSVLPATADELGALPTGMVKQEEAINQYELSGFLPRMQVCNATSDACKVHGVPIGNMAVVPFGSKSVDVGTQVDVFPIAYRMFALDTRQEKGMSSSDPNHQVYKDILEAFSAGAKFTYHGPQVLCYIPIHGFVSVYYGTKSMAYVFAQVKVQMNPRVWCSMEPKLIEKNRNSWYVIETRATGAEFELPPTSEIQKVLDKFLVEETTGVEEEEEEVEGRSV